MVEATPGALTPGSTQPAFLDTDGALWTEILNAPVVSGTVTSTAPSGQNALPTAPIWSAPIAMSNTTTGTNYSSIYYVGGYRSLALYFSSYETSGSIAVFESTDQSHWQATLCQQASSSTSTVNPAAGTNYLCNLMFPYVEIEYIGGTAGTYSGTVDFSTLPANNYAMMYGNGLTVNASEQGVFNVGTTVAGASTTLGAQGSTVSKVLTTASTNLTALKVVAGSLFDIQLYNRSAAAEFAHFYNTTAAVTVGTTVPFFTIGVPAGGSFSWHSDVGINFPAGMEYAVTTGNADTDATATAAGDITGTIGYK